MTKTVEVAKLQSGDHIYFKGLKMTITSIEDELTGVTLNLMDETGRGFYELLGADDVVALEM